MAGFEGEPVSFDEDFAGFQIEDPDEEGFGSDVSDGFDELDFGFGSSDSEDDEM